MTTGLKSPEKINLQEIEEKFQNPLKPYTAIEVESSKEAKEQFEKLTFDLEAKSETKTREQGLQRILQLLKGGIRFYPGGDLKAFAPYISSALSDMRPALNRMACLVVASEAQVLEDDFILSLDTIFPPLIKLLTSSNLTVAHYAHFALRNISLHCMNQKVAKLFLSNASSPIPANRQIAIECAHIIVETWPSQIASLLSSEATSVISALIQDPIPRIRQIAIAAAKIDRSNSTKNDDSKIISSLPFIPALNVKTNPKTELTTKRSPQKSTSQLSPRSNTTPKSISPTRDTTPKLEKSRGVVQDEMPNLDITQFMPPTNTIQAKSFKSLLDTIVEQNDFTSLDSSQSVLVESVLYSLREIPHFSEWKFDLGALFHHYESIMTPYLIEIMVIFNFSDDIMEFASEKIGIQQYSEMLISDKKSRNADIFKFFVCVFKSRKYHLSITPPISQFLTSLIKSNSYSKDKKYLENALEKENATDVTKILNELLADLLNRNHKWSEILESLSTANFDDTDGFDDPNLPSLSIPSSTSALAAVKFFDENLPSIIRTGTQQQIDTIIEFLTLAAPKLKGVSFKSSLRPLMDSILQLDSKNEEDDGNYRNAAIECIAMMMFQKDTLIECLMMLNDRSQDQLRIVLQALYSFVINASPQKIFAVRKIFIEKLHPFLSSDDQDIRRTTISIFAECRRKIPREFLDLMKKNFTATQIRLIELKANQSSKKK